MSDNQEIDSSDYESPLSSPPNSKTKSAKNRRFEQMRKNIKCTFILFIINALASLFKTGKSQSCKSLVEQPNLKPVLTHSESTTITRSSRIDAIRSNLKSTACNRWPYHLDSFFTNARQQLFGSFETNSNQDGDANSNRIDSPHSQHSLGLFFLPFSILREHPVPLRSRRDQACLET